LRARRFKAAVELARDTIQSVATETHRRWAEFLNQRVTQLLAAFGTRVEQLRFGDDLDFSVSSPTDSKPRAARRTSSCRPGRGTTLPGGTTRHQRVPVRGQSPLPLLLDDPFATSDDERARPGCGC